MLARLYPGFHPEKSEDGRLDEGGAMEAACISRAGWASVSVSMGPVSRERTPLERAVCYGEEARGAPAEGRSENVVRG